MRATTTSTSTNTNVPTHNSSRQRGRGGVRTGAKQNNRKTQELPGRQIPDADPTLSDVEVLTIVQDTETIRSAMRIMANTGIPPQSGLIYYESAIPRDKQFNEYRGYTRNLRVSGCYNAASLHAHSAQFRADHAAIHAKWYGGLIEYTHGAAHMFEALKGTEPINVPRAAKLHPKPTRRPIPEPVPEPIYVRESELAPIPGYNRDVSWYDEPAPKAVSLRHFDARALPRVATPSKPMAMFKIVTAPQKLEILEDSIEHRGLTKTLEEAVQVRLFTDPRNVEWFFSMLMREPVSSRISVGDDNLEFIVSVLLDINPSMEAVDYLLKDSDLDVTSRCVIAELIARHPNAPISHPSYSRLIQGVFDSVIQY
jgi:hypothetical protein